MKLIKNFTILLILAFLISCASVKVYKYGTKEETGIKFYNAKPFLLLTYSLEDNNYQGKIISLPDLSEPQEFKIKPSIFGSLDVSFKLDNGILVEYGQTSDSKIPEIMEDIVTNTLKTANMNPCDNAILYEIIYDSSGYSLKRVSIF